jgi:hypothetical protein
MISSCCDSPRSWYWYILSLISVNVLRASFLTDGRCENNVLVLFWPFVGELLREFGSSFVDTDNVTSSIFTSYVSALMVCVIVPFLSSVLRAAESFLVDVAEGLILAGIGSVGQGTVKISTPAIFFNFVRVLITSCSREVLWQLSVYLSDLSYE